MKMRLLIIVLLTALMLFAEPVAFAGQTPTIGRIPAKAPGGAVQGEVPQETGIERILNTASSKADETSETNSDAVYRLSFTLHVFDREEDRGHSYTLTVLDGSKGRHRAIAKVPVRQGATTTYVDSGVKCDVDVKSMGERVRLNVLIQVTDVVSRPASEPPVIYDWQAAARSIVIPNETTLLFNADTNNRERRYQLEVKVEQVH